MANTVQATKRAQQSKERSELNGAQRSKLRTIVKKVRKETLEKNNNKEESLKTLRAAASLLDKSATKGLIHKNKAARLKSRLNRNLKAQAKA